VLFSKRDGGARRSLRQGRINNDRRVDLGAWEQPYWPICRKGRAVRENLTIRAAEDFWGGMVKSRSKKGEVPVQIKRGAVGLQKLQSQWWNPIGRVKASPRE